MKDTHDQDSTRSGCHKFYSGQKKNSIELLYFFLTYLRILFHFRVFIEVIAPDGHTYERSAIEKWIREHNTSPQNPSLVMTVDQLMPNRIVQSILDQQLQEATEALSINRALPPGLVSRVKNETRATIHVNSVDTTQSILHIETPNAKEICISSHICCVIDISGSMCTEAACKDENGMENRTGLTILDVVKFATNVIAKSLKSTDKLSIVTYNDQAQTVLRPTFMDDNGKAQVEAVLKQVRPSGRTNLWGGIKMGCDHAIKLGQKFVSSVFVLTDGIPNIHPPLGYDRSLKRLLDNNAMFGTLSTFGFGYNLETKLLVDIANMGGGTFSFIPDSGFVGTCFINALANARCSFGINPSLRINGPVQEEDVTCDGQLIVKTRGEKGMDVQLTPLRFGASMDIVFNNRAIHGSSMELAFQLSDGTEICIPVSRQEASKDKYSDLFNTTRVDFVKNAYDIACTSPHSWNSVNQKAFIPSRAVKQKRSKSNFIDALCKDMEGQATEAISRQDWFFRWGAKYLFSLMGAHLHQFCNNFKDPGVQIYGEGELFVSLQEDLNDIFEQIPPPKPAVSIPPRSFGRGRSCAPAMSAAPVSMARTFNNRNAVCVHGETEIFVSSSWGRKSVQVANLRKGDKILTEDGSYVTVQCVVETISDKPFDLFEIGKLQVTPYHPIKTSEGWKFPIDCQEASIVHESDAYSVFNMILEKQERSKPVMMNGLPVITLGHGITNDPVLKHEYFGSDAVVSDIMKLYNAEALGHVVLNEEDIKRTQQTGDIYSIKQINAPETLRSERVLAL